MCWVFIFTEESKRLQSFKKILATPPFFFSVQINIQATHAKIPVCTAVTWTNTKVFLYTKDVILRDED